MKRWQGAAQGFARDSHGQGKKIRRLPESRRGLSGAGKVLAGQGNLSDQDFLERMAENDSLVDHDGESCGMCCNIILGAQVAREMLEAGEYEDVVSKWATEAWRRWENTKFFKLWQQETKAKRDPHKAFQERGWEP